MTRRLHPGWLVALFALVVSVSAWLPWLTTAVGGGGWASAIGGKHGNLRFRPGSVRVSSSWCCPRRCW